MTLRERVSDATERLAETGVESPRLEAEVLAAHCLVKDRSFVLAHGPDRFEIPGYDQLVARRSSGEPLAYILGWREFYSRRFKVTPAVLIPRHETEVLIEAVLKTERRETVLDVGTGSGCIAVTLALESPETRVTAVEVNPAALEIARENADALGAKVEMIESDLFGALQGRTFDIIASNPPYVAHDDDLPAEVKDHEPHLALYADDEGMAFHKRLAKESARHLNPDGRLIIEIGDGQDQRIADIYTAEDWPAPEFVKDLDRNDRVAVLRRADSDLP